MFELRVRVLSCLLGLPAFALKVKGFCLLIHVLDTFFIVKCAAMFLLAISSYNCHCGKDVAITVVLYSYFHCICCCDGKRLR